MRHLFRAYDIRGRVGGELNAAFAYDLGQAIGSEAGARGEGAIAVGRDGRRSSPSLATALREGLMATGLDVFDLGPVPTPVVQVALQALPTRAAVIVTGSHNPPADNGFKVLLDGAAIHGEGVQALWSRLTARDFVAGRGREQPFDPLPDYFARLDATIGRLARPLRVVVDAGNGIAGRTAPAALRRAGAEVIELYCEVDGSFPHHHPDPLVPANLADLQATVRSAGADLGLAFDGDGDRLGVVCEDGTIVWPDRVLMAFADEILATEPGAPIVFDVKCSRALERLVRARGGRPEPWKTGHSLTKARRAELDAPLAGEYSGHLCFRDWCGGDDALYAGLRLARLLARDGRTASALFAAYPTGLATPELRADCADPAALVARLAAAAAFPDAHALTLDGLRLEWPAGWALVRASNTAAQLVFRFEAEDLDTLMKIQQRLRQALLTFAPDLTLPF
ncbi:phosphomannomutase/phosphoglucomutase [Plasticicumulans lactativorans]|uniref:phosphomannomutase n=1 Tax=Plasticicumulans lactativorans TaxID=1133106 RepID=A0A4R2L4L6_9GAMM|nr:phosphomannomutase/phosphoglucomutase [Plasticicumulans lactativorans]TCO81413.1 phosphomannomutase/phosphoglucomutase [Plasticicumulans lactativorans]